MLLADTDTNPDTATGTNDDEAGASLPGSLRLALADTEPDLTDALPLGVLEPLPAADVSAQPVDPTAGFRLALE